MKKTKIGNIEIDVAEWGLIKGHICSRGFKKNSLWIVEAMREKRMREICDLSHVERDDLVNQASGTKSRIELMARLASCRCQYDKAARLGAIAEKADARSRED
jgi:hypothetical protein